MRCPSVPHGLGRRRPLGFGQIFTISLYALTPAIALDLVLIVSGLTLPHFWLIYFGLGAAATALAVLKIPEEQPAIPAPVPASSPPPAAPPSTGIQEGPR